MSNLVRVQGLSVALPDGSIVVENTELEVEGGEVVSILGPSGSGKTTVVQALLTPDEMRARGCQVFWTKHEISEAPAFVPQRGALLDHLDVSENVALAQAGGGQLRQPEAWLRAVELDEGISAPGRSVSALSGGQAQRVAIARVLAAGRRLIVLDEPSVGLDPMAVRTLARLLVKQARDQKAAIILITHDLALAGGASDKILFLDPVSRKLARVPWNGPAEFEEPDTRQERLAKLEVAVEDLLLQDPPVRTGTSRGRRSTSDLLAPFRVAGDAIQGVFQRHLMAESAVVFRRTMHQGLVRPALFYATVGALLGFTVPYVIANISQDLRPAAVFGLIKGTYILSLSPPLSAIIFVATTGSAISAWLGGLRLHGQVAALEGVGVPPSRYLWSPTWLALVIGYLATFGAFTLAMIVGGWALYWMSDVKDAFALLSADFLDPPPSRIPYLIRAVWSVVAYALAAASIVVAKGSEPKSKSDDVTAAMTSSIMRLTLFVVVMELLTVMLVRALVVS